MKKQDEERNVLKNKEKEFIKQTQNLGEMSPQIIHKRNELIKQIKKKRRVKKIVAKIFFQFLFCNNNYVYLEEKNEYLENFLLLTHNRKPEYIFLISSNSFRIVSAMDQGFCAIPIIKF